MNDVARRCPDCGSTYLLKVGCTYCQPGRRKENPEDKAQSLESQIQDGDPRAGSPNNPKQLKLSFL